MSNVSLPNRKALGYILSAMIPVTVTLNLTVLIGLIKTRSAGSRLFIIPLCINDLLIGAGLKPLTVFYVLSVDIENPCRIRQTIQFLSYLLLCLEFFLVATMGLERLIVLKYPMSETQFRWEAARKYVLICDVFTSLVIGASSVLISLYTQFFYVFSFWLVISMAFLALLTTACYVIAVRHVQKSVRALHGGKDNTISTRNTKLRHDLALARSVKLLLCIELSLIAPYDIASLVWTWEMTSKDNFSSAIVETVLSWTFIPIFFNSIINIFLYSYYNRPLKNYLSSKLSAAVHSIHHLRTTVGASESATRSKRVQEPNA